MSLSTRIAPHLAYLRRFSRAVTGSQTSGDAYVAAMLEALVSDISLYPEGRSDRIALYRLYCTLFDNLDITLPENTSPFGWERQAAANLSNLPPAERKAFLLVAVEGFDIAEGADIMDVPEDRFSALLDEASRDISRQVATDIMIIEDEPLIAMDIEDMVKGLGHRVTGIARTHSEAVELYHRTSPRMVLADIQLADGSSGIDAVNDLLSEFEAPVIFITAFPERLLTGSRPEPTFLITKPFAPEMVKAMISQALFFDSKSARAETAGA